MNAAAETENSENKSSFADWREATVSLAAFATSRGGTVHFGVGPDGKRLGVSIGKNTLENLANDIKRHTDPPIFPSIEVEGPENSAVVRVFVEESPIKPVWAFGRPYKRVGRSNHVLSREETLRLSESTSGRTWDALPCPGLREEDLSREAIEDFLRRSSQDTTVPTGTVIENLRLRAPDGILCNAAALLFAKNLHRLFVDAYVKCGRFRGDEAVDFIDEMSAEGTLFEQFDKALAFVARNTRHGIKITGRPEREIVPEYPDAAIREALANAICHRDYAQGGHVQIRIFDSGLEVWNPGRLPSDLTIGALYTTHHSHPRNRLVAGAFHRARLIEHWGTGTNRIVRACEEHGMSRPEFRSVEGGFVVFFTSKEARPQAPEPTSLSDRQRRTLAYVKEHGSITTSEYQKVFGIKERQARKDLKAMVEEKLLKIDGVGPATRYLLPD